MSTIKVDTYLTRGGVSEIAIDKLKGASSASSISIVGEGGTTTTNLQQGLAKAWSHLNVNGGTPAIRDTFNIASITDIGTGNTRNTFTNAMSNADFSVPSSADAFNFSSVESYATTSYQHRVANASASSTDRDHNVSAVFGDLA